MTEVFTDPVLAEFDWRKPDYAPIVKARMRRLMALREQPELIGHLKRVYRDQPWRFINDWGNTSDPRHVEVGLPVTIPFILFPRQIEWCQWLVERWKAREPGATVKSRDMGITWLSVAMTTTMCMFYDDLAVGFGSRKLELVDSLGDPKCIFWKARKFIELAPSEFTGQWSSREKLISFGNGSTIAGEGGDDIGRGARTGLYVVDEAANVQHQESVDAALSATSNCRQFVSTPRGSDNAFAEKVTNWPERRVFRFHWREDPRKDDAWYAKQVEELDPVVLAQEVDMDFNASKDGVVIPQEHVQAALDAHIALNLDGRGERRAALDIADEGMDNCAWATARGIVLDHIEEWSGKGSNLYQTTVRAFGLCDQYDIDDQLYDADGMGAHMKGDAQQLNAARRAEGIATQRPPRVVNVVPFWGAGAVERKDSPIYPGAKRLNGDYYKNLKAQSWGELQYRFRETWRARNIPDYKYDPDRLISISSAIPARVRSKLMMELSQPTWGPDPTGKMIVDKKPDVDGRKAKSPNMADVVMMLYGAARRRMVISPEAMRRA
jgi:hypothetical protein